MKNRFYLTSSHGNLGSNIMWHRHNEKGYTSDLDQAHVYTREQAQKEWAESWGECQPISADHVDELAIWKVDCQYIPKKTTLDDDCANYVAYKEGQWDGNDVFWMSMLIGPTTNFSRAYVIGFDIVDEFLKSDDSNGFVVIPKHLAEKAKRRTFEFNKLNRRRMIQGAGLITPKNVRKINKRVKNPMSRFNCHVCGKINWQHNPYDFEGCKHCYAGAI